MKSKVMTLSVITIAVIAILLIVFPFLFSEEYSLNSNRFFLEDNHILKIWYYPVLFTLYWIIDLFTSSIGPNGNILGFLLFTLPLFGILFSAVRYFKKRKPLWLILYGVSLSPHLFLGLIITSIEHGR